MSSASPSLRARRLPAILASLASLASLGLVLGFVLVIAPSAPAPVSAANAGDFQAGYIISDANFFDSESMSAAEVQAFLNGKVTTCRGSNGMPCLKDYRAQSTPQLAATAYCRAYPGGGMSAAELIVQVSRACGLNPKVLLVMLQKEQGLITSTAPTPRNYSAALGQGCPDGAECDPAFAGFFYQVYGAARQMQIYMKHPRSFAYQLGWNNILYQATPPDSARVCGTKRVFIQNDATRALYIYTPYTPNQAALNNLYGTGDFCSAYGNRNFWRLYTDWFGSPTGYTVVGEYERVWAALGAGNGLLGAPTGAEDCNGSYCQQPFAGGRIYWFPGRGVFGVPSVIDEMWRNLGFVDGAPGKPTGVVVCNPDGTCTQSFDGGVIAADGGGGSLVGRHVESAWVASGGISLGAAKGPEVCSDATHCAQLFARGALFAGGTAKAVTGAIFAAWSANGGTGGALGYPVADVTCKSAGCVQRFGGGLVVSAQNRTEAVPEPIAAKYTSLGGLAAVGGPVTAATCDATGACNQRFRTTRIDSSSRGVFATMSWFLDAWAAAGYEQGRLRSPLAETVCTSVTCYQSFQGGILSGAAVGGVVAVYGAYRDVWVAAGGPAGMLGLPVRAETCNGVSCSQVFQGGTIVWTQAYGAITVSSWFLAPWQAQGAGSGRLGAPTARIACLPATCYQSFQGGILSGAATGGVVAVYGAYRDVWVAAGGPAGTLGLPVRAETCNGVSCSQVFQGGTIVWTQAYGAITVSSWFLAPWQAQGASSGRLGAPTAPMACLPESCYQSFRGGTLSGSPSGAIIAVYGSSRDVWMQAGGPGGTLGLPVSVEKCDPGWCISRFERGAITSSTTTGAIAVQDPIFAIWERSGGPAGPYGLPVAAASNANGSVSQQFQRGTISTP